MKCRLSPGILLSLHRQTEVNVCRLLLSLSHPPMMRMKEIFITLTSTNDENERDFYHSHIHRWWEWKSIYHPHIHWWWEWKQFLSLSHPPMMKMKEMKMRLWKLYSRLYKYRVVFSVPPHFQYQNEEKKLAQPTRSFFTLKISWKSSPDWLQLVVHFSTANREE